MSLQYITDSKGKTTGVFIPIEEWNSLKRKYKDIEQQGFEVPEWQKDMVKERLSAYQNDPDTARDFEESMDDIEKDL